MNKKLKLELSWWLITLLIVLGVLLPIYMSIATTYPFYFINVVYIVVFVTLARYIFLLKYTFLAERQRLKLIIFFLCIPLVFYLIQELNYFQTFLDEEGFEAVVGSLSLQSQDSMVKYIRNEMLLFAVGGVISGIVLPIRLMISIWRLRNLGTI